MPTYQQKKVSIYKWRVNHMDAFRDYQKNWIKQKRIWKKIQQEFLAILLY
jgi:hypothetical protein